MREGCRVQEHEKDTGRRTANLFSQIHQMQVLKIYHLFLLIPDPLLSNDSIQIQVTFKYSHAFF